ncbi:F-box domain-containing protein [Mycena venus]|uniref:F-box domain-containing protein n=1 Tax=Mycena venus TaxID=2733690 RepID=A0A8H6X9B7_9AGAR|nr:F-box domain-containing protein [Mycena venus]
MHAPEPSDYAAFSTSALINPFEFDTNVTPGTRHHALLNTNEIPEGSEIPFILSVVSETDSRLASLDDAISKLRAQLEPLEKARASLLSYRTQNNAILSPLRKMPPELLGEIFSWTLPSFSDELDRRQSNLAESPWVLTHVSSSWRAVAHSTPSLWSRVLVNYDASASSSPYPLSLVEAQIQRSQKLMIHFRGCEEADSQPQIMMFRLLSQYSSRWEELGVRLTPQLAPLLADLRDRVPSLKRLWIDWTSPESQTAAQPVDCFQTAGSLVDVGMYNEFHYIPVSLPLHQLTRYEIDAPWDKHVSFLTLATNLVEVRIDVDFVGDSSNAWAYGTVELLHLRRLYVSDPRVLGCLQLPVLEELALRIVEEDIVVQTLESFVSRSACPLRSFCLEISPSDVPTMVEILQKLSTITQLIIMILYLSDTDRMNTLLSTLTVSKFAEGTAVAPQLSSLIIGYEDDNCVDCVVYFEMVKSRWRAQNCALKSATLLTKGPCLDPDTFRGLHELRDEGLDFFLVEGADARTQMIRWTCSTPWTVIT